MTDPDCIAFLQWALPRLGLQWPGYRKVRAQVCKRIERRRRALGLADIAAYRAHLDAHPAEWELLDGLAPVTISRFWRDRAVFTALAHAVLPAMAALAVERGEHTLRAWSIGCGSGEEPYSLIIAWHIAARPAGIRMKVLATDVNTTVLERARAARYTAGSLRALPPELRARAFTQRDGRYCLRGEFREDVTFAAADFRRAAPAARFHLVLCRNLAFTYFDAPGQAAALNTIRERLLPGGVLVIGARESLPADARGFAPWPGAERLRIYRYEETSDVMS